MIDLIVTGHETPEMDREEIARLLNEYGVGAVCLLRNGLITSVLMASQSSGRIDLGDSFKCFHAPDGTYNKPIGKHNKDIIRVFPPGTRLRVTVEVVND